MILAVGAIALTLGGIAYGFYWKYKANVNQEEVEMAAVQ